MLAHRLSPFVAHVRGEVFPLAVFARSVPPQAILVMLLLPQAMSHTGDHAHRASRAGHRDAPVQAGAGR
jgi:hypothetical protein